MSIVDFIRRLLKRSETDSDTEQDFSDEMEPSPPRAESLAGLSNALGSLLQWEPSKPVLVSLGALIVFSIVGAWLYPQMVRTPSPKPFPTPRQAAYLATPTPAQTPAQNTPSAPAKPGSTSQPGQTPSSAYPAPGQAPTITVITPTPRSAIQPGAQPKAQAPSVPTPPRGALVPSPVVMVTPPGPASPNPIVAATATTARPPGATVLPGTTSAAPSATPVPGPTNPPGPTPTPGPTTAGVSLPVLATGTGYYYVIDTLGGEVSATWKTEGTPVVQLFLFSGTPFGGGTGTTSSPPADYLSSSNAGAGTASLTPLTVQRGTYTVYFFSGAMVQVTSKSASISYLPASIPTPVVGATSTPRPATGTATPTPRPTTGTPTPTPGTTTPTATPTVTATPTTTATAYPGPGA